MESPPSAAAHGEAANLAMLAIGIPAVITGLEPEGLDRPEAQRLRELGFDEGVRVEIIHRAPFGQGPIACRVGRMTVAIRRHVAAHVLVSTDIDASLIISRAGA